MKLNENNDGTQEFTVEEVLNYGAGTIYKGAPDTGFAGGPAVSPQYKAALNQGGGS